MVRKIARAQCDWLVDHNVELHFIDLGKPAQNAWIESFNAPVREEFFNLHSFHSLDEARGDAAIWLADYNEFGHTARLTSKRQRRSLRCYPRYPQHPQPPLRLLLLHIYQWPNIGAQTLASNIEFSMGLGLHWSS